MHCLVQAADIGFEQNLVWLDWYRVQTTQWWQGKNTWSFPLPFDPKDGRQAVPAWFAPHSTLFENPIYISRKFYGNSVERWNFLFFQHNILTKFEVVAQGFYCTKREKSKAFVKKLLKTLEMIFFRIFFSCFKSVFRAKWSKNWDVWVK